MFTMRPFAGSNIQWCSVYTYKLLLYVQRVMCGESAVQQLCRCAGDGLYCYTFDCLCVTFVLCCEKEEDEAAESSVANFLKSGKMHPSCIRHRQ